MECPSHVWAAPLPSAGLAASMWACSPGNTGAMWPQTGARGCMKSSGSGWACPAWCRRAGRLGPGRSHGCPATCGTGGHSVCSRQRSPLAGLSWEPSRPLARCAGTRGAPGWCTAACPGGRCCSEVRRVLGAVSGSGFPAQHAGKCCGHSHVRCCKRHEPRQLASISQRPPSSPLLAPGPPSAHLSTPLPPPPSPQTSSFP